MNKFLKLCSCEYTKIIKKKSTKIMLVILILALLAAVGITALTKKVMDLADESIIGEESKNNIQVELDSYRHELIDNAGNLDEASKNELQARIDTYQFAVDNDVNIYVQYWKSDVICNDLYLKTIDVYNYKSLGQEDEERKVQEIIDKIRDLIKKDDYTGYIRYEKDNLKTLLDSASISKEEHDERMYILNLKEKYEIGKVYSKEDSWKSSILHDIEQLKLSLQEGIDQTTFKALTEKRYEEIEDMIKVDEYRLEHNLEPYASGDSMVSLGSTRKIYDYMAGSFIAFVLTIMMVIIAGTSISSEISKGTIKFWSFTPYKRWKILLSKLVVSTFILIITTIIISLISAIVGNIFFGANNAQGYLYVSNGNVKEINYVLFSVLYNLVGAIEIFVFMLLALMLSTVTRSSAVAVGVSIASYLGGATIMQIINLFVKSDWIKFIPFNNLSLTTRIFVGDVSYGTSSMISGITGNISLGFSFAVLGVCSLLMIVTMFDSFRKRDIL